MEHKDDVYANHILSHMNKPQGPSAEPEENGDINHIIFTSPSARAGYDTRSIFQQSLTGFNSEFSFSWTSYLTKAEEPSLSYYLPIAGGFDSHLSYGY